MNEKEIILEAMKKAGEPLNAGKVAELTGLDRKGWLRFGTWTGVLILSFAGLVLLTSLRRR